MTKIIIGTTPTSESVFIAKSLVGESARLKQR